MTNDRILIADDDAALREALCEILELAGYQVRSVDSGSSAMKLLEQDSGFSLLLSDVQMRPGTGIELLQYVQTNVPDLPVVLMAEYGQVGKAVQALHDGAVDYLVKPFEADALADMAKRYVRTDTESTQDEMLAIDPRSKELQVLARKVAVTDATVMITGESGVGKEIIAQYIHLNSRRSDAPFIAINCAAIPENMLESVLFGYEKGAFTGAYQANPGKFEQAQGGTLLLDEITEMDLGLQAKLLRVLQEREVERLGGREVIVLNVRILATTNRDIRQAVEQGDFREDLYYRLNVFPLNVLPLRDRPADILPLANKLIRCYSEGQATPVISPSAQNMLMTHYWPGNVRELDNVIQRAMILKHGLQITEADICIEPAMSMPASFDQPEQQGQLNSSLMNKEKDLIMNALQEERNRKEAAAKLGISPRTLRYKLAKLRDQGFAIPA